MSNSITITIAKEICTSLYNIQGEITQLPGELDANFRVKKDQNNTYILKISQPDIDETEYQFQQDVLKHLATNSEIESPVIVKTLGQKYEGTFVDSEGRKRNVRLLTFLKGRIWNAVNPKTPSLRKDLGTSNGILTNALKDFNHKGAQRKNFDWDIAQGLWTKNHLELFNSHEQEILIQFQSGFESQLNSYKNLRKSIVHNDVNDNNIIVTSDLINPRVKAIIDFGDTTFTQVINDVAITISYAAMDCNDPLQAANEVLKGYHSKFNIQGVELEHLYHCIGMRLVISVTKSAINKRNDPDNEYLLISEQPAWDLLKKWVQISPQFALYSFRAACNYTPHPNEKKFEEWIENEHFSINEIFPTIAYKEVTKLDLSVGSSWIGHEREFNNLDFFQYKINEFQKEHTNHFIAGGYLESRPIYTSTAYDKLGNFGPESRTVHLGIDFWLPEYTPVHSLFDGEVVTAIDNAGNKEYGGLIILKHREADFEFFSLYGHLNVTSALKHKIGDNLKKGEQIGLLGNMKENGNWAPHLHFQIMHSLLDYVDDFPGVCYFNQLEIWKSLCPDPNLFFKTEGLKPGATFDKNAIHDYRMQHLGKSLSLQYKQPLHIVRGAGAFLVDYSGRKYLDTVNNVAHVGHENYAVVKKAQQQIAVLNTNTRYLHEAITNLTENLLETLPSQLKVVHYVNSGSEANELALRMAKAHTKSDEVIVSEVGYHGNTNKCVEISSYKFDGKGGTGAAEHVHVVPMPDAFRGKYRGDHTSENYLGELQQILNHIKKQEKQVGALIFEPIISCGGQVELPDGFLAGAYTLIREAGGICISDEVQTGCGRMGKTFWGFQLHDVIPDIMTIGKPFGNGHPVAAVVCTQEIAESFANGMEYFNTFGGNPVSCTIANEVLNTIKKDRLQENAHEVGSFLKGELHRLQLNYPIIGDVRGQGLFLGIEFVDTNMNPLPEKVSYLVNRMKDFGILMSSDGPDENVLKIKPPIVFSKENAHQLLITLEMVLQEDFMQHFS